MKIIQQVANQIRQLLLDNLIDPNRRRVERGNNWIFTDFPRADATMPRIGIIFVDGSMERLAIGSPNQLQRGRLQVSIFLNKKGQYYINDELEKSEYVLDYLANEIIKLVYNNQSSLRDENVLHVLPINESFTEKDGIIQRNLDLEILIMR